MNKTTEDLFKRKYSSQKVHISVPGIRAWLDELLIILFPVMGERFFNNADELQLAIDNNKNLFLKVLTCQSINKDEKIIQAIGDKFYQEIFEIEEILNQDIDFFCASDPACVSKDEVISAYPGFYAIACYRLGNRILKYDFPIFSRMITEIAHQKTGIDIHPNASIGSPFFIDHGTGVVVGETTIIGNRVILYQGVTQGALKVSGEMSGLKRHPTVEDDCVIYANATILGGETVIGKGSTVGGNVWLSKSVAPQSLIYKD